jgi:multimeric flavodoxin WrbA
MKKAIIINTTPRKGGNCSVLADKIASGLSGYDVKRVDFQSAKINYCVACEWCKKQDTPKCVQKDDMAALVPELDACDAVVLLAPIYYNELSAQAKTVVDRLYPFFNPAREGMTTATKTGKKAAVVVTSGQPTGVYLEYADNIAGEFAICGFTDKKALALGNGAVPGQILDDKDAAAKVDELVAWLNA